MIPLTSEQRLMLDTVRRVAREEFEPRASAVEEEHRYPRENLARLAELGFLGLTVPERYGGVGQNFLTYVRLLEEVAGVCINTAGTWCVHVTVQEILLGYAQDELARRLLPEMATAPRIGALCITEPGSGSDAASLKTICRKADSGYVLQGQKIFITTGGEADVYVVFARRPGTKGAQGISAFLVEKETPGLSFGPPERKMGYNGSPTTPVYFEDCVVPAGNLLGEEDAGFRIVKEGLAGGRIAIGAICAGLAARALSEAAGYAKERKQFGKPVASFQMIRSMLADMAVRVRAARLLTRSAAAKKDAGEPVEMDASMAKLFASDAAMQVTTDAVQVLGGYGYLKEYRVERYMRQAKIFQIVEGTNQIQRLIVSKYILSKEGWE